MNGCDHRVIGEGFWMIFGQSILIIKLDRIDSILIFFAVSGNKYVHQI